MLAPSTSYHSALGLCGGPDVPHVALDCRLPVAGGNDVGVLKAPPVLPNDLLNNLNNSARKKNLGTVTTNLTFKISPIQSVQVTWETTLIGNCLYVTVPSGILPEGSKESLVTLLEYAEEKLNCSHVVLFFSKKRTDRVALLRVFNFFGFHILPPGHELAISTAPELLFMVYTIEKDDSDDSEDEEFLSSGIASSDDERYQSED